MITIEAMVLGLVGVAIGSAVASALVLLTSHTGLDYAALTGIDIDEAGFMGINMSFTIYPRFEFRHVVYGLCAVTLVSVLASVWPAALTARLRPAEAMRS